MVPQSLHQVLFICHYSKVAITGVFSPALVLLQPAQVILSVTDMTGSQVFPCAFKEENTHLNLDIY